MKVIIEDVNFKRGLVTYEIDCYNYIWLEIFYYVEVEPEEIIEDPFTMLGEAKIYKKVQVRRLMFLSRITGCWSYVKI